MMFVSLRGPLVAALFLALVSMRASATPGFWQAATQADFLRGEVDRLSIDEHGRVMLGPEVQRIYDGNVPVVWTALPGSDGSTYLGTGNDGKVIKVDRDGKGTVFFDSEELEVHALAPAPNGGLFVGTSPDGRIYKVDAKGQATPFFDPDSKYIWALALDGTGNLLAATGDKGTVYRISPEGKGEAYFNTRAAHALALAVEASGHVLVSTGSPGRVFRVDNAGKGFLLLDTSYEEIRALRLDAKGVLYAAAQNRRPSSGGGEVLEPGAPPVAPPPQPSVSTEIMSFAIIDVPVAAQSTTGGGAPAARASVNIGAVYRVLPDGLSDVLWESRDEAPYDVLIEPDGAVMVATGNAGKILRLAGDPPSPVLVTRVPAQHATLLHRAGDRTMVTSANPGLLLSISGRRATAGTYQSDVKDARMVATWGTLTWRATVPSGAKVEMSTRSGNTKTPDEAWSPWSTAYAAASGSAISSPKARYLQWRAVLTATGDTPVLTSVSAAYLQRNVRPQVTSITVHPPGVVFQKPFSTGEAEIAGFGDDTPDKRLANQGNAAAAATAPALGRRIYQKGLQTFVWKADDDNGDELEYSVVYRREGETTWRPLESGITESIVVWDTSSVPNGTYVLKVIASDVRANADASAHRGELESNSFDIDNTPPTVSVGAVRRDGARFVIAVEVKDADSPLSRVDYSLDGQRWRAAFPLDGILDGRDERFELSLGADAEGRAVVIRATDALNNVSAGQVVIRPAGH